MTTVRSLDGQQVKWNYGAIDLMWPGQRGDTKGQPLHPNLRLRWAENLGMVTNIFTRIAFVLLLAASLSIGAFVFSPLWLIPPVVAILLNIRIAMSMKDKTWKDVLFAASGIGAEVYMWLKAGHFVRAWTKFLSRVQTDNWAEQAKAERGSGNSHLVPLVVLVVSFLVLGWTWFQLPVLIQSSILWLGWPVLYVVTIAQTIVMAGQAVPPPARLPGLTRHELSPTATHRGMSCPVGAGVRSGRAASGDAASVGARRPAPWPPWGTRAAMGRVHCSDLTRRRDQVRGWRGSGAGCDRSERASGGWRRRGDCADPGFAGVCGSGRPAPMVHLRHIGLMIRGRVRIPAGVHGCSSATAVPRADVHAELEDGRPVVMTHRPDGSVEAASSRELGSGRENDQLVPSWPDLGQGRRGRGD